MFVTAMAHNMAVHLRPISRSARLWAVGVGVVACALLATAAWLTPDPSGLGTHRQLGLPPCNMVLLTGLPCPTCGMTTAFAHMVRGRLISAVVVQPAGAVLALGVMAAAVASWGMAITGWGWCPPRDTASWFRLFIGFGVIAALSWAYKIMAVVGWNGGGAALR